MRKFSFRLQKVLEYRESMEQWAQDAYLDTRVARLEAEAAVLEVDSRRKQVLTDQAASLDARKVQELRLQMLDEEERQKATVVEVLKAEEEKALAVWHEKKQELEAMVKLSERAKEEWMQEQHRREQGELDEWATQKRGA